MKHYIEIENVGPIKKAKIDLSKYVVLIGPQGSGKSIIAKLIAIFQNDLNPGKIFNSFDSLILKFGLNSFFTIESKIFFSTPFFLTIFQQNEITIEIHKDIYEKYFNETDVKNESKKKKLKGSKNFPISKIANNIIDKKNDVELSKFINVFPLFQKPSIYIPAERIIISLLSQSIYSLIKNKINLPELLLDFAANYEQARNEIKEYKIKFLKANYSYKNGKEILEINKQETLIAEAASGFQTLIPMLLVCEFFLKDKLSQTYIIEEPELNLFPTAQKDLIYHLINIINNSYSKEQNTSHDLVMTTHSPYILASLNNLLLAGKIKEEQPIKFTKAKKIVNGDYYISKNDLNVYALKNGKAKSIISKETGLIAENELDHVSEEINYEFNALKNLYFESAN